MTLAVRRATEADLELMRRLWNDFSAEANYTPYPSGPFEPALVRDHVALVAEGRAGSSGRSTRTSRPRTSATSSASTRSRTPAAGEWGGR